MGKSIICENCIQKSDDVFKTVLTGAATLRPDISLEVVKLKCGRCAHQFSRGEKAFMLYEGKNGGKQL